MAKNIDYPFLLTMGPAAAMLICAGVNFGRAIGEYGASHTNMVYRDINGDGVNDKITQVVSLEGKVLEEEVLFGVKANGKTVYLPKESFE